jgi:hypothetical protein
VPGVEPAGRRQLALEPHLQIIDHCCDAWNKLIDQP